MKATEVLSKIKNILGVELSEMVKLEECQLENGTILEAEKFESDQEVFIKSDEESIPLPVGMYELEDGRKLIVVDEGIINEIKSEEDMSDKVENLEEEGKEEMGYATKEELNEVKSVVEEIKAMIQEMTQGEEPKEEEMSAEEVEVIAEELQQVEEEVKELKEELSKPAAEPIKHSPESETENKQMLYSQNRPQTTADRVFAAISNIRKN